MLMLGEEKNYTSVLQRENKDAEIDQTSLKMYELWISKSHMCV